MKNYYSLFLLIFALALKAQPIQLNSGLIGAYPFEIDSNFNSLQFHDTSGINTTMNYQGTAMGHPDRKGGFGAVRIMDILGNGNGPNEFISHNASPKYPSGDSARSFSFWFMKESLDLNFEAQIQFVMFYGSQQASQGCGVAVDYAQGQVYFLGVQNDLIVNYNLQFNQWYHIVATYDGDTAKMYLNDSLVGQKTLVWNTFSTSFSSNPRYGYFFQSTPSGGSQIHYNNSYKGFLDDVLIYNRVLNSREVTALYGGDTSSTGSSGVSVPKFSVNRETFWYPNPTQGRIQIPDYQQIEVLRVLDQQGREMLQLSKPDLGVDLSALPAGLYWLQVEGPQGLRQGQLVKH